MSEIIDSLDALIAEFEDGVPFDSVSYKTLVKVRDAIGKSDAESTRRCIDAYMQGYNDANMHRDKQAELAAQPYAYVYEFDSGIFGIHRSFSSNERNGSKPSRVVPVYTHPAPPVAQEQVAWQFYDEASEKWCNGLEVNNHRKNTEAAGIKTRDLFPQAPADVVRDLVEAIEAAIDCGMVPVTSAKEGGAAKHSIQVQVADQLRSALKSAKEHGL